MIEENCNKKTLKHILYHVVPAKELNIMLTSDETHHLEIKNSYDNQHSYIYINVIMLVRM